jgi:hypothetical protein
MVNNSTDINKMNNHLSPQVIEHKNDHKIVAMDREKNVDKIVKNSE